MCAAPRTSLVPRPAAPDKRPFVALFAGLMTALSASCGGAGTAAERHDRMYSVSLLDAGERGHFLRPDPRPTSKPGTRRQHPAGPANASLYRASERKKIAYGPQASRGAARPPHGNPGQLSAQRIEAARAFLGTAGLSGQPFVAQVLRSAGQAVKLPQDRPYAAALYDALKQRGALLDRGEVRPGDLVFFRNTLDLNSNDRPDDGITFVALVEKVGPGRVVFIGQRAGRVRRMAIHLASPDAVRDGSGQVINTRLVRWPGTAQPLTAARCFAAWARP